MNSPRSFLPLLLAALVFLAVGATTADAAAKPKHGVTATVAHKTLTVTGDRHANKIALRVKRRAQGTLVVDVGDDRSADFSINRKSFDKIAVRGGAGNDVLRIDEGNGGFTNSERTTVDGQAGTDRLAQRRGPVLPSAPPLSSACRRPGRD